MIGKEPVDKEINTLKITPESRGYLEESAKWGRVIAIVGFIFSGLIILFSIITLVGIEFENQGNLERAFLTGTMSFYLVMGLMFFIPSYYLYNFSEKINTTLDSFSMKIGMKNLKLTFKFYGIFIISMVLLYVGLMAFVLTNAPY